MIFLWVWLLLAHPHAPPVTCQERCKDVQCRCADACKKTGAEPGYSSCYTDCYDQMIACTTQCDRT